MAGIRFKYTNRQLFIGCASGFFAIIGTIAFVYILFNLNDFLETHALETVFLIIMGAIMVFSFFAKMNGGKELKSKAELSGTSLIVKGEHRYMLTDLMLDEYQSENYHCFHLYNRDNNFTLYTNEKDDLIKHLLESDVQKNRFEIEVYDFERNSSTVMIQAKSGRMLGFNLDSGSYSIFQKDDADEDKALYEPEYFIQTPGYKRKQ
ncbi:hypothetical protein [Gracilimonas sp. BCB1]|uniref:hypothetical protein n=1 Tax=Gracilimonas sp. BCB1 TaxID=3152362 RepID=UPI0032D8E924